MAASFAETFVSKTMSLDLSKTMGTARRKLEALCTDIFLIVIRMREAEDLGAPASLRKLIAYYLSLFEKNCRALGMQQEAINSAKYALVALLDETVLSVPGPCRDHWVFNPMQLELFGDNIAGEEFFRKLDALQAEPEKMKDALTVFYLCLSLGFEGKYRIMNPLDRDKIIENLGQKLSRFGKDKSTALSPHGRRVVARALNGKNSAALVPLWAVAAVSVGVCAVCWVVLKFVVAGKINTVFS